MRIVLVVLSLVVLATLAPKGGSCGTETTKGGGVGVFMFGWNGFDVDELRSKLRESGFEGLEKKDFTYGGGGYGLVGERILLGGEGYGFEQVVFSDSVKATLGGGYGFFDVGYVVLSRRGIQVYPMIGIGGGGMDLRLAARNGTPQFDEVLENPRREATLSVGGLLLQCALGVDYFLSLGGNERAQGGLIFGLRLGYTFASSKGDWSMKDADVIGGPDARITGPYIHFAIGGAGFNR
ncbi:MAG: hypothetical protein ACE5OR_10305 [bacterium]